jgi:hypothetical protein
LLGGEVEASCDVYALGLIAYEMLVGSVPIAGRTNSETLAARSRRDPPDPRASGRAVSGALAELVLRCLSRDRTRRPAAREIAAALESAPVVHRGGSGRSRVVRVLAALGAAAVLAVVAMVAWSLRPSAPADAAAAAAPATATAAQPPPAAAEGAVPPASVGDRLDLRLDAPAQLSAGSPLEVKITSNRIAYVLLLNVYEGGAGAVLLPNKLRQLPTVRPEAPLTFPSVGDAHTLRVELEAGKRSSVERIVAYGFATPESLRAAVPAKAFDDDRLLSLTAGEVEALCGTLDHLPGVGARSRDIAIYAAQR